MTILCDLAIKYGTDKAPASANGWGYTPHYFSRLNPLRQSVRRVLEIGICGQRNIPNNVTGASLYMWRDFFPNAEIFGVDNDSKWMLNIDRITSFCFDAYNTHKLKSVMDTVGRFDFIVDDAVHEPDLQIKLLCDLWPYLVRGGLYAVEDVCPYKLPDGDLSLMTSKFPSDARTEVISTHKSERLLLVSRCS